MMRAWKCAARTEHHNILGRRSSQSTITPLALPVVTGPCDVLLRSREKVGEGKGEERNYWGRECVFLSSEVRLGTPTPISIRGI